jgi:hypothetical protein
MIAAIGWRVNDGARLAQMVISSVPRGAAALLVFPTAIRCEERAREGPAGFVMG